MHTSADLTEPAISDGSPRMSISSLGLLLFAVAAAACAQLMLKYGMQAAATRAQHTGGSLIFAAAASPWVLGGLTVFAVSTVAWLGALSRVPLSVAYPFTALGYIAILTASAVFLHERTSLVTWAGSLLVVSGLLIVVLSKP